MRDRAAQLVALGAAIRAQRVDLGMSIKDLASASGIVPTFLEGLEKGRWDPTVLIVSEIARALKTEAWELLRRAQLPDPRQDHPTEPDQEERLRS